MKNYKESYYIDWNPWHGCHKYSSGCVNCYVYRQDKLYNSAIDSSVVRKNALFDLPIRRNKDGSYKIPSGKFIYTCFESDFLLDEADKWREECFKMIKERSDCYFCFFTKRIDRLKDLFPEDWGSGYDNVIIGCTTENQKEADYRLPIFLSLPIKYRYIIVEPMLEEIDISKYLDNNKINVVSCGGESGPNARVLNFDWVLKLKKEADEKEVPFRFHQTGANFIKNGKTYFIKRSLQQSLAKSFNLNTKEKRLPKLRSKDEKNVQLSLELFD